ncbi:MAG: hypothetical protein R3C05_12695 [Pirellulaceae bacterium]
MTPAEIRRRLDAKSYLVNITIEPFGGDTVLVSAYPTMLAKLKAEDVLRQAIESLMAAGQNPEVRDLLDHLLQTMACKAAVKAGDRLTPEEITAVELNAIFTGTRIIALTDAQPLCFSVARNSIACSDAWARVASIHRELARDSEYSLKATSDLKASDHRLAIFIATTVDCVLEIRALIPLTSK